ncbi:MAG: tetratricopeptide repeat protein [Rhodanobacteraceae bacterium]|nr:MAG: tetratricopeptide repeat protein [Rhodanobacteraceae bacterium]
MSGKTASALVARIVEQLERGDVAGAEAQAGKLRDAFPDDAELARLHGVALFMLGRGAEARRAFEQAVRLAPDSVEARSNLAGALQADGDVDGAVALLEQVVRDRPSDPALRNNLANALRAAGDDERARGEYLAALAIAPDHFGAIVNLAATELSLGRTTEAETRLREVLAAQPHPQALLLLGHVLNRQARHAEAQAVYQQAAQLAPDAAQFPYQAGLMADEQHHYGEAVRLYRRALQLDPNLKLAEGQLLFVLRRECEWDAAEPLSRRVKARALDGSGSVDPFAFLAEDATPAEQLACARARAARVERDVQPLTRHLRFAHATRDCAAPLKVGFLSAGFHAHATALLTAAMFEHLGRLDDIELHLFASTPDDGSDARRRLHTAAHGFHVVAGEPATAVAQRVHDTHIDVLVDVDGWCAGGMPGVFAFRPAPVQASWLAYPGTTGAACIDYLIADRFLIPEPLQGFYSESVAYLPRCYQPSDPARPVGAPPPRSAFGLPDDAVVFASFNNSWKLNAASFSRICAVLREVPGSVLWLLDAGHDANMRLRDAARLRGLDPQRLVFSPALPHLQHLARYELADLFLDTNPYNAHTTASDAIWAGCPVLTRPGETFASRVAGSLNHHLGMPELIARDDKTFVDAAIRYGNDRSVLAALRERLAGLRQTSGLFDMQACARDFAALLRAMDERRRKGMSPQTIALPSSARQPE